MLSIKESLRNEVLSRQQKELTESEKAKKNSTTAAALAEYTSLQARDIEAVTKNLQDEVESNKAVFLFPELPKINLTYLRIAIYLILGLMGYSGYKAAEVRGFQEVPDYRSQSSKFDLQLAVPNLYLVLGSPYHQYYMLNQAFPKSIDELESVYGADVYLDASKHFDAYRILENGTLRLTLSESYGYNRWIELTPQMIDRPLGPALKFSCRSNAQSHLLYTNGDYWCEHDSS